MPGFSSSNPYQPLEEPIPEPKVVGPRKTLKQRFHHPATFSLLTALALVMSSAPGGYQGGVISTIEKRFQLSNTQAGTLATFYDVMALTTVVFITHFGQSRHRPRVIGCLQFIAGTAMIVTSLPHFLYPAPGFVLHPPKGENDSSTEDYMCHPDEYTEEEFLSDGKQSGALMNQFAWMYVGTFLASFSSPVIALAIPYIDDSVDKQSTSVYAGELLIINSVNCLGRKRGFLSKGH